VCCLLKMLVKPLKNGIESNVSINIEKVASANFCVLRLTKDMIVESS